MKKMIACAALALVSIAHGETNAVDVAKFNLMWTDYTNRMERARIFRERREARRNSPPSRPFRVKKGVKK